MKMKIITVPFMALLLSFVFSGCYSARHNDRYYQQREYERRHYHHHHHDKDRDRDRDRDDYGYRRN